MVSAIAAWHFCRAARASINRPGPRNSLAAAGRRHQRGRNPCRKAVIREQGFVRGVARLTVQGELNPPHAPAVRGKASRNGPCTSISLVLRPIAQLASFSLVVGFLKQEVQLARCCVLLNLFSPCPVVLLQNECRQFGQLSRRKLTHRAFNLRKAHDVNLCSLVPSATPVAQSLTERFSAKSSPTSMLMFDAGLALEASPARLVGCPILRERRNAAHETHEAHQ
jgi:hypothetical protein